MLDKSDPLILRGRPDEDFLTHATTNEYPAGILDAALCRITPLDE
jgi:hypothetical protein